MRANMRESGVEFTPAQRTALTETTLKLGVSRLQRTYNAEAMWKMVKESGFVRELAGLHMTLTQSEPAYPSLDRKAEVAADFARKTIIWSLLDLDRRGVKADPNVVDQAKGVLGTERI